MPNHMKFQSNRLVKAKKKFLAITAMECEIVIESLLETLRNYCKLCIKNNEESYII